MGVMPFRARERLRRDDPQMNDSDDASMVALRIIDCALREVAGRRLVSSAEVVDLLLDLRFSIALDAAYQELREELEVH